jgi:putative copper resistance protein D
MHEGWLGRLHRATDLVHVLASGGWFGALPVLALILKRGDGAGGWADVKTVLTRFSAAGLVAVALMILTGILNTALVLGRWPVDWSSPYQALLAAKVALVLLMIGVAGLNRYGHTRRFDRDPAATAFAIRRGAMGEIALGAGVIGLVAVLGVLRPV